VQPEPSSVSLSFSTYNKLRQIDRTLSTHGRILGTAHGVSVVDARIAESKGGYR
jgi:hypothetical protein